MAQQIIYKKRFLNKLDKLLTYLEKEWTPKIAEEFLIELNDKLQLIKRHPFIGSVTVIDGTRCMLITKHNKLYYRIENNKVAVTNMIDIRKNLRHNRYSK